MQKKVPVDVEDSRTQAQKSKEGDSWKLNCINCCIKHGLFDSIQEQQQWPVLFQMSLRPPDNNAGEDCSHLILGFSLYSLWLLWKNIITPNDITT